ncbi:MAG: S46 family peptidase [Bacteroidota bacterium]
MKRKIFLLMAFCLMVSSLSFAQKKENHEGMWLPHQVKDLVHSDMQTLGLELPAEQVYNEEAASLEDAIVKFDIGAGSCTGEMISPKGLMLTNHHCAYDGIATLSDEANDYLTHGFWAMKLSEEKPVPGMSAGFLVHSEDVTSKVLADGTPNPQQLEEIKEGIIAEAIEGTNRVAEVKEMFHGLEYHLFVYDVYTDLRLVGAPPSTIGKFGGDTDNWMWPRHTGDFSLLRVYAGPDNQPAEYSPDNQPYQPKHFLPISIKGVEQDDYAMIMGYPGRTTRYLTSSAIEMALEQSNQDKIDLLGQKTSITKEAMDASDKVRIAMAGDYASDMNQYKYYIGQTTMLNRYDVIGETKKAEKAFQTWAEADASRNEKYGTVLKEIDEMHQMYRPTDRFMTNLYYGVLAPKVNVLTLTQLQGMAQLVQGENQDAIKGEAARLRGEMDEFFDGFFYDVDKEVFASSFIYFYKNLPEELHPPFFASVVNPPQPVIETVTETVTEKKKKKKKKRKKKKKTVGVVEDVPSMVKEILPVSPEDRIKAWTEDAYASSFMTNRERMNAFLDNPTLEAFRNDKIFGYVSQVLNFYRQKVALSNMAFELQVGQYRRDYMAGMKEMHADKTFYPDANSTMRVTYGTVMPYEPRDGVMYDHYTTLAGVIEKDDPNSTEFDVPEKLKTLFAEKDFGEYGEDGRLEINFLTTNDITGGNSGSPVINGKGELIGVAFDGNWEAMSSDIHVFPELKRTICVDARYVLFVIEKYAGASHLLDEMTIVK